MKKIILIILGIILLISIATATILSNIDLNLTPETKITLLKVGKGIGNIEKIRVTCDEFGDCINETYTDKLTLIGEKVNDKFNGNFKLYEEDGINKEFKIKLENICSKEGTCDDEGMKYDCCLEWREETDEEILIKAEAKSKEILNKIASVTEDRENRDNSGFTTIWGVIELE